METTGTKFFQFPDGRLDASNAAKYLGLSEKTLATHRGKGTGPEFVKIGRIFYYQSDLDAWMAEHAKVRSTAELRAKKQIASRQLNSKAASI